MVVVIKWNIPTIYLLRYASKMSGDQHELLHNCWQDLHFAKHIFNVRDMNTDLFPHENLSRFTIT